MAPRLQCLPTSYQPRGPDPERVCSAVPTGPQSPWILVISEGIQGARSLTTKSATWQFGSIGARGNHGGAGELGYRCRHPGFPLASLAGERLLPLEQASTNRTPWRSADDRHRIGKMSAMGS